MPANGGYLEGTCVAAKCRGYRTLNPISVRLSQRLRGQLGSGDCRKYLLPQKDTDGTN